MKICNKCKQEKDDHDFLIRRETGIIRSICRECHALHNKKSRQKRDLFRRGYEYGINANDFERIKLSQGNLCPICLCKLTQENQAIDHNHSTGVIRGVLCQSCNLAIGNFKDDITLLTNAIKYLESTKDKKMPLLQLLLTIGTGSRLNNKEKDND